MKKLNMRNPLQATGQYPNASNFWTNQRDEKAGLPRDAIRSQCSTCSRHKEKETGNAED
jgi:hypothetical protein